MLELTILMSDKVKNAPELRIGLINEILPEAIFIRMDKPLRKCIDWTTVRLPCQDVALQWNTRYLNLCLNLAFRVLIGFLMTHYTSVNGKTSWSVSS
jgi:hypothetical protein